MMKNTIATPNASYNTNLQALIEYPQQGILSKVILKDENCQYTLFCLAKGTEIEEHTSTRNATIMVFEGAGKLTLNGEEIRLNPGVFVFMPAHAPHALAAEENLAFVLTLSEQPQVKKVVSPQTIELIKSTAPLLKKQGQQITSRMYEIMFQNHPEVKEQFNMRDQENGSQPARLATAIYSYATHIDDLEALKSMVERVAHRHVETHVQPEQYSIVGESLLRAMKDVLGEEAVTDEVMAAWKEAYQLLAEVFINREHQIYEQEA
ncbi:MAG: globin domain-containing protein [Lyngbya sp.]|nr:globin domain-containing protein [Lyngbya sp.]